MASHDEERLGELLSSLPPAPEGWVRAAKELPLALKRLEVILERAQADDDYRRRVVSNPQRVLEEADVVAHAGNIELIRRRLDKKDKREK